MKLSEYRSWMYCQQCGHDLKRVWRYPYGIDGGRYCTDCASGIQLTRARKVANFRQPATIEYIQREYKAGTRMQDLADQFMVSKSFVRTMLAARWQI